MDVPRAYMQAPTAGSSTEYYHIGDTECVEAMYGTKDDPKTAAEVLKKSVRDTQRAIENAKNLATFVQAELVEDRLVARGLASRSGSKGSLGSREIVDEIAPTPSGWMSLALQAESSKPSSSDSTSEAEEVQTFSLMALRESDSNDLSLIHI